MLFNSFEFALFLPIVFILYWKIFNRTLFLQNFFLLGVSYLFYGWWDWRFLGLLFLSSVIDYFAAIQIKRSSTESRRKRFLWLSMCSNLGMLFVFKYYNFFSASFAEAFQSVGVTFDAFTLNVVLPVGISFYTFQTMSYTIDIYNRKLEPARDPVSFFAYVSFFPQLVAGPIERAVHLLPQFYKTKSFTYERGIEGLRFILWGFFKKVVIADNCAVLVNSVFHNVEGSSGLELVLGAFFFALQIYGDFSGYSDIAIGTARLFGFDLMTNFKTPYFSRDIAEFWRRWHISLSTWFRDYLYIPLGGSQNGKRQAIVNTIIIFVVSGFWHGANWTYIAWGALNALYFLPLLLAGNNRSHVNTVAQGRSLPSVKELFQMSTTFVLVLIAWVFFRSPSIADAVHYLSSVFTHEFLPGGSLKVDVFLIVMIILFFLVEWQIRESGINEFMRTLPNRYVRFGLYYSLAFCIWFFGAFNKVEFIYFQF